MLQRKFEYDHYYWNHGTKSVIEAQSSTDQDKLKSELLSPQIKDWEGYTNGWALWHAYTMEFLSKTKFRNNDTVSKTVTVLRTEEPDALLCVEESAGGGGGGGAGLSH